MFRFIKKMLIGLLNTIVNGSNHAKCLSLNNRQCMTQLTLINLHPNEYTQGLHYYPFAFDLNRFVGSCKTLNELSNKVCFPNRTEDLNLSIFIMITWIKESETLTEHVSCKCKCKLGGRKCNSNQK